MKVKLKSILLSLVVGITLFFLSSLGFFTFLGPKYFGIPFQFVTSDCYGIVCTASPIFHWLNFAIDIIFWSVASYVLFKLVSSKSKK